jgi:hypothetical protein
MTYQEVLTLSFKVSTKDREIQCPCLSKETYKVIAIIGCKKALIIVGKVLRDLVEHRCLIKGAADKEYPFHFSEYYGRGLLPDH